MRAFLLDLGLRLFVAAFLGMELWLLWFVARLLWRFLCELCDFTLKK